jgi:CDP-diacylglycerol---serine O-phosphatidyltransferase
MKHLPNIITVGNLFCGCCAIAFILYAPPYLVQKGEDQYWVIAANQAYKGALFIFVAAILDFLDGAVARALNLKSELGGQLDSLADVVSFGVAPSMIMAKLLWAANMQGVNALDVSMLAMCPAFLIACFGAVRLAKFNLLPENNYYFTGMPIPAAGITVASLALINFHNSMGLAPLLQNKYLLLAIIALVCWLMVSQLKLFTLKFSNFQWQANWGRYVLILLTLGLLPILKFAVVPVSILLYILLSFFYKPIYNTQ